MTSEMESWSAAIVGLNADGKMTDKQMRIVQAAIEMFAEKGYAATSTSEIAQKAGVAEGTIFRHYKTKKDLLVSIVVPTLVKLAGPLLLRDVRKVVDTEYEHFEDFLRALMRNRLEFAINNASVLRIVLHEIPFHPELQNEFMNTLFPQVAGRVKSLITRFQEQGELIEMPPFTLLRMVVSSMAGYILTRSLIMPERDWNDEVEMERTIQYIMHGLTPARTD